MGPSFAPPISDYGMIGDGRTAALVSRSASIDFCCLPRFESGTCFGRLLDWSRGGHWSLEGGGEPEGVGQRYLDGTLVLETTLRWGDAVVCVQDVLLLPEDAEWDDSPQLVRTVEGREGEITLASQIVPRFDYADVRPWIRRHPGGLVSATGGDDAIVLWSDVALEPREPHLVHADVRVRAGERVRFGLRYVRPHELDRSPPRAPSSHDLEAAVERTTGRWRSWCKRADVAAAGRWRDGVRRSALTLKALTYPPTGAMVAAATTSLPEVPGGDMNWDYRYAWIRDATFSVRSLAQLGYEQEAEAFRRFVERSAAGDASQLRIAYDVGGGRRLDEVDLGLDGYRAARPVRAGNAAANQLQLGVLGMVVDLAWSAGQRGHLPDAEYWSFLRSVVDRAAALWSRPDSGLWEWRAHPQHFTQSKVMCWSALDHGLELASRCGYDASTGRWRAERDAIRTAVERHGYDHRRGVFVQTLGGSAMDADLLLLPRVGFVTDDDPRMVRTLDAIVDELGEDGLLYREPSTQGREGVFLAASFWLVECLVGQRRLEEAQRAFHRAVATANHVGLFAEEYDPRRGEPLGNVPQALVHYSHIAAALALARDRA